MHAIDGGNIILEIQQNSDTTYRVYDWGRMGLDGKPRACTWSNQWLRSKPIPPGRRVWYERTKSRRCWLIAGSSGFPATSWLPAKLSFRAGEEARLLAVTAGRIAGDGRELALGANVLFALLRSASVLPRWPSRLSS